MRVSCVAQGNVVDCGAANSGTSELLANVFYGRNAGIGLIGDE